MAQESSEVPELPRNTGAVGPEMAWAHSSIYVRMVSDAKRAVAGHELASRTVRNLDAIRSLEDNVRGLQDRLHRLRAVREETPPPPPAAGAAAPPMPRAPRMPPLAAQANEAGPSRRASAPGQGHRHVAQTGTGASGKRGREAEGSSSAPQTQKRRRHGSP